MNYTKAELQVQLRSLMRGGPGRLPISTMKKHELESYIDSITELRADKESATGKLYQQHMAEQIAKQKLANTKVVEELQTKPLAKKGPPGPRQIPVEAEQLGEDDEVIKVPGQPPARLLKAPPEPKVAKEPKAPALKKAPAPKKDTKTVSIEEPSSGKSAKVSYYPGGCPTCGKH